MSRVSQIFTAARLRREFAEYRLSSTFLDVARAMRDGKPSRTVLVLADSALEGCGIDSNGEVIPQDEGLRFCPRFSYVNLGDTYARTFIRDHARGGYLIASWGDLVEELERRGERF